MGFIMLYPQARGVLLILAVGLFAAVWAGDRPPVKTVVFATDDAMFVESTPAAEEVPVSALTVCPALAVVVDVAVAAVPVEPAVQLVQYSPAPAAVCSLRERILLGTTDGIAAGDYLAVATDGTVQPVSFDADLLHQWGHLPSAEPLPAVTLTLDGRHLTLVRIAGPTATVAAR